MEKKNKKKDKKKKIFAISTISLVAIAMIGVLAWVKLNKTTPEELMDTVVKDQPDTDISVGIWQNGDKETYSYNSAGKHEYTSNTYQIGSITKTFTGAMIAKEISDGRLNLDMGDPSLKKLITHRSGLSDQWERSLEKDMERTFSKTDMMNILQDELPKDMEYDFCYSNFGSALAGSEAATCWSEKLDMSYEDAMNQYIKDELGLKETKVGGQGDFTYNWSWKSGDEMVAAGAITSTVSDLLLYGQKYLEGGKYKYLQECIKPLDKMDEDYDIGYFWIIDSENDIIWHNGELAMDGPDGNEVGYQSFIGISPSRNKVVVVLSNAIANDNEGTAYTDMIGYLLLDDKEE